MNAKGASDKQSVFYVGLGVENIDKLGEETNGSDRSPTNPKYTSCSNNNTAANK